MMSTSFTCFLFVSLLIGVKGLKIQVAVNGTVTFPCTVQNPDYNVKWFKNPNTMLSMTLYVMPAFNKRMSIFQPYSGEWNLHIYNVQLEDAGEYSCRVANEVIEQVDLMVGTLPMIHVTPDMTFQEGDTGILWCNATGSPTPDVRWSWKSTHQNKGIEQCIRAEGNPLVLHNITRDNDNIYVCSAENTAGSSSAEIRIHVNFGPEVEVFQNTVAAVLGQEVTLTCAVEAYPMDGELEWVFLNNNSTIHTDWKYDVSTDKTMINDYNTLFSSLTIREGNLGDEDYDRYVCRAINFSRGQSQKELILQRSLLIDVKGVKIPVPVNTNTTLPCTVQTPVDKVKWFKNPTTIVSMGLNVMSVFKKRMRIIQPYLGQWNLHIDHAQLGDAGEYSCRVGNEVIEQVDLMVETPPMIHVTPETTFHEGHTGTLLCNGTGSPTPDVCCLRKSQNNNDGTGPDWQPSFILILILISKTTCLFFY